jgi:carbonic anhydrase/acetyltransferase-like protein (isoleucine patch superfamily)
MIIEINGKKPKLAEGVFVAPNAVVIGDVEIGEGSSIWYGAVIRGDLNSIRIGRFSNVQDNCTIHVDGKNITEIGDYVTIGHNAVLHGCRIGEGSVIGLGSILLNGSIIGKGSIVAAGAVVRERQEIGENQLVAGSPAVFKRELDSDSAVANRNPAEIYVELAKSHLTAKRREL